MANDVEVEIPVTENRKDNRFVRHWRGICPACGATNTLVTKTIDHSRHLNSRGDGAMSGEVADILFQLGNGYDLDYSGINGQSMLFTQDVTIKLVCSHYAGTDPETRIMYFAYSQSGEVYEPR